MRPPRHARRRAVFRGARARREMSTSCPREARPAGPRSTRQAVRSAALVTSARSPLARQSSTKANIEGRPMRIFSRKTKFSRALRTQASYVCGDTLGGGKRRAAQEVGPSFFQRRCLSNQLSNSIRRGRKAENHTILDSRIQSAFLGCGRRPRRTNRLRTSHAKSCPRRIAYIVKRK
jgi:hypothetical protein